MEFKSNEMIECECGKKLLNRNFNSHIKTNQHIRRMTLLNEETDIKKHFAGFNYKCRRCDEVLKDSGEAKPCQRCYQKYLRKYYPGLTDF